MAFRRSRVRSPSVPPFSQCVALTGVTPHTIRFDNFLAASCLRLQPCENVPFQPHLEYHRLSGRQAGIQAVSVTGSYRITMTVAILKKEIILLDIGSHDEVYR